MQELEKKVGKKKDIELSHSRWLQQTGREATHARVKSASPKSVKTTTTPRVMNTTPLMGICVTLDTIMQHGARPDYCAG